MQKQLQEQNALLHQEITEHTHTENALQARNQELSLLHQFAQMLSASLQLDQVLHMALEEVQRLLEVISASFWLISHETHELICQQAVGPGSEDLADWRMPLGQGITGWVAEHGESALVADTLKDERHIQEIDSQTGFTVRSILSIPLRVKNKVIGVLNLVDQRINHFTEKDLRFLEPIAAAAAIAIENAKLYTQLQNTNESKDQFFSILSHDLRNSFTVLLGYAESMLMFLDTSNRDEIRGDLETLQTIAQHMYTLLENLLTWSRLQRGAMTSNPGRIDLQEIAKINVELFFPKAEQKQIALINTIQEPVNAFADGNMVDTIMRNLVSNAVKFTHPGGSVEIAAQSHNDGYIEVSVTDTGTGIPEDTLSQLFQIDAKCSTAGTDGEEGTGLGLPLCKDLVEKNGGSLRVTSGIGKGTVFSFTLPTLKS
jgi:signal transduction histidine kinase